MNNTRTMLAVCALLALTACKNEEKKVAKSEAKPAVTAKAAKQVDPKKAQSELSWSAQVNFEELMRIMVESDLEAQERATGRRRGSGNSR